MFPDLIIEPRMNILSDQILCILKESTTIKLNDIKPWVYKRVIIPCSNGIPIWIPFPSNHLRLTISILHWQHHLNGDIIMICFFCELILLWHLWLWNIQVCIIMAIRKYLQLPTLHIGQDQISVPILGLVSEFQFYGSIYINNLTLNVRHKVLLIYQWLKFCAGKGYWNLCQYPVK